MHGTMMVVRSIRNRKGRKRKQGKRSMTTGDLVRAPQVNYRELAAEQPHRACLPERHRLDDRAGTVLGTLLLTGALHPNGRNGQLSTRAVALYQAGRIYASIIGRLRAVKGGPKLANPKWHTVDDEDIRRLHREEEAEVAKGYYCPGQTQCALNEPCECNDRIKAYNNAHDALALAHPNPTISRGILKLVHSVAAFDQPCPDEMLPILRIGLGTLVSHFGLES